MVNGDHKRTFKSGPNSAVIKCNYFQNTFRVPWSGKALKMVRNSVCGGHERKIPMYTSRPIVFHCVVLSSYIYPFKQ